MAKRQPDHTAQMMIVSLCGDDLIKFDGTLGKALFLKRAAVLIAGLCLVFAGRVEAADITFVADTPFNGASLNDPSLLACSHQLTGPIVASDVSDIPARLNQPASQAERTYNAPIVLCLNSEGGSFQAGIELAKVFREQQIITMIEPGARCVSACAIAFMGGGFSEMSEYGQAYRVLHPGGQLGFHAPAITLPEVPLPGSVVSDVYQTAQKDLGEAIRKLSIKPSWDFSRQPILPNSLLVQMMLTPSETMFYVTTVNEAALWEIELPLRVTVQDLRRYVQGACHNSFAWAQGVSAQPISEADIERTTLEYSDGDIQIVRGADTDETAICKYNRYGELSTTSVQASGRFFRNFLEGIPGPTDLSTLIK